MCHPSTNPHNDLTVLLEQQFREVYDHNRVRGLNTYLSCTEAREDVKKFMLAAFESAYSMFTFEVGREEYRKRTGEAA